MAERNSVDDLEWVKIGDSQEGDGHEDDEVPLDDLSPAQLRELVLAGRKRVADLKLSIQDQAKQIKELKEHLSGKEHKAPSEALPTAAESLCAEVEQAREREELWKMCARNKISYTSFEPGDCALFLPTSSGCVCALSSS
eukprot:Tamp_19993.p1 GENE.Tamp_19993~~Tamp_19993.p1  ORF type:complete len:140 (+),score=53.32 Tamp_19993:105-524(+)